MARLKSQDLLKDLLKDYFTNIKAPLAWCTSAGPAEILRALGFEVYFPENHGAMLGATRLAQKYMPKAHQAGYSTEICSYLTADIGAHMMGETPLTKAYGLPSIPKPDLIVFNTNQCREVAEWFNYFGREFNCPVLGIFPPRYLESIEDEEVNNVAAQFERLITLGEKIIGKKLDRDRLSETLRMSREASILWKSVLNTAQHAPTPLTFWDGTILMAPIVVLRGTQSAIDFYRETLAELQQLKAASEAAIPGEQLRIYWEGMPIWGKLRSLADFFKENQAAIVASTYCNSWVFDDFDPADPVVSMARAYTQIFINRGENAKLDYIKKMISEFNIDGIIFHDSKTCFNNANSRFGLPERINEVTGVPVVSFDGDLVDLRFFSEEQTHTRLETFFEQLQTKAVR